VSTGLDRVRSACFQFPGVTEKRAWGEPTFRAGGRMFAAFASAATHHGDGRDKLWCRAPAGAQAALVEAAPDRFFVPPYVGKDGWLGIELARIDDLELEMHLHQAYLQVVPDG
jgi:hypothetical protein